MLVDIRTENVTQHHVTVKLCKPVSVTRIELSNEERFSSRVRHAEIWGRREQGWPWERLADAELEDRLGSQNLKIDYSKREVGELMVRIKSHYGQQYYVALTKLWVEGTDLDDEEEEELQLLPETLIQGGGGQGVSGEAL